MAEETRLLRLTLTERDAEILSGCLAHMTTSLSTISDPCVIGMLLGVPCRKHDKHLISPQIEERFPEMIKGGEELLAFLKKTDTVLSEFTSVYCRAKYPDTPGATPTIGKEVIP